MFFCFDFSIRKYNKIKDDGKRMPDRYNKKYCKKIQRGTMNKEKKLSESLEDYLEVILELETTQKVARAKDIAEKTGVKRGSVTSALKSLGEKKLIHYEPYSYVTLTSEGKKIAEEIRFRHSVLKDFLHKLLQIDEATAEANACRMEHAVDQETLDRLVRFFDFVFTCPRTGEDWIRTFMKQCGKRKPDPKICEKCMDMSYGRK